jgi:hypothetical protein
MLLMSAPATCLTFRVPCRFASSSHLREQEPCSAQDHLKQVPPIGASLSIAPKPGIIDPGFFSFFQEQKSWCIAPPLVC